jgi:hypothetical protein
MNREYLISSLLSIVSSVIVWGVLARCLFSLQVPGKKQIKQLREKKELLLEAKKELLEEIEQALKARERLLEKIGIEIPKTPQKYG